MLKKEAMTAQEFEATLTEQLNRKHKLEYENAEVDEFLTAFMLKDCSGLNFAGRKFAPETSLRGVILCGANLSEASLPCADLTDADMRGADLKNAHLGWADLRGADLRGADLRGADLRGADLKNADLRGANLEGAVLDDFDNCVLPCGANCDDDQIMAALRNVFCIALASDNASDGLKASLEEMGLRELIGAERIKCYKRRLSIG